jgi:hypothetical protein
LDVNTVRRYECEGRLPCNRNMLDVIALAQDQGGSGLGGDSRAGVFLSLCWSVCLMSLTPYRSSPLAAPAGYGPCCSCLW